MMLDIMRGPDHYDNLTYQAIGHYAEDGYSSHVVEKKALHGMKLGLPWDPYWSTNAVGTSRLIEIVSLLTAYAYST